MPHRTLLEYLGNFRRHACETAYEHRRGYRGQRWSYGNVLDEACRFARELELRGIGHGDKVLLWGENCAEWVAAFFGCALRGSIVVPIDKIAAPEFAARVAQQVNARLCVSGQGSCVPGLPRIELERLRETVAHHSAEPFPSPALTGDDIVEIVFTSGTTAEPRGVVLTHGNILANLEPIEREAGRYLKYERIFHPLRMLNLLPLSHVFGQFLGLFIPQLLAATVIFHDSLNPGEIVRLVREKRISVVIAVPRLMETLKDKIEREMEVAGRERWFAQQFAAAEGEHFARRWWRFRRVHNEFGWKFWAFISGGAALDSQTEEFWRRLSFVVVQGYGLTETTSMISLNHPFRTGKRSIGKVLEGREMKLDGSGEILVRGASVAAGYWQGNQLRPVLDEEGWFHTGDLGEVDAEGNLYFRGRKKNVIVTREGMNIYPDDLESALRQRPQVRDCVVVPLQQGGNAEACAVLLLRDSANAEAVVLEANRELAEYQRIRQWLVWPEQDFPRTPTQKPRTNAIQQYAQAQVSVQQKDANLGRQHQNGLPQGSLAEIISRITGRHIGPLSATSTLEEELNLSSMDRIELMSALEDRYQVDLGEANFANLSTVGELERLLKEPEKATRSGYKYPRWALRWPITWIRTALYYLLSLPATLIMAHPSIESGESLRRVTGPVLIVCNHVTYIDVGFVLIALPPHLRHKLAVGMHGERLWHMWRPPRTMNVFERLWQQAGYYLVVALFNVFPLPQESGVRESFAYAGECADRGYNVLVFPEGRRTPDGQLSPFRSGVGMLASRLNVPVVPMRIHGLYDMKLSHHKIARGGELRVVVGQPVSFPPGTPPDEITNQLEKITERL